ncbi:MAG: NUDIX domain-containing protein [Holosporales bacterium]|jgi:ADP-ribose pyrophosphatase YjhB (NUDIX family)|nr:NUDIX domain-containing protein [Holosporales bacterium]
MQKSWYAVVPAVYLVLENAQNKILLLKRLNTGYMDGFYSLVAGHIEAQEKPSKAIIREAYEEAGIKLHPDDVQLQHIMCRYNVGVVDYFFKATHWEGMISNKEPEKCSELAFYALEALPENTVSYVREALSFMRQGVQFSEFFDLISAFHPGSGYRNAEKTTA